MWPNICRIVCLVVGVSRGGWPVESTACSRTCLPSSTVLLYGCWIKTASSMLYSFHQNMYPRETWTTAWNYAGQPYNLWNNRKQKLQGAQMMMASCMWTYPQVFPCPLAFIPLGGGGGPRNLCRMREWHVILCWRWRGEIYTLFHEGGKAVSRGGESEEIKICVFSGEWLCICHVSISTTPRLLTSLFRSTSLVITVAHVYDH